MDDDAKAIREHLANALGATVVYKYTESGQIHGYKIGSNPAHWVYVSRECLDDTGLDAVIETIDRQVVNHLKSSPRSRRIAIESNGVRPVDRSYGR